MTNIKVTKREYYDIEGSDFDAVLSEDLYKHDPKKPFVMTIKHSETQETISSEWFQSKDDALDYFSEYFSSSSNRTSH